MLKQIALKKKLVVILVGIVLLATFGAVYWQSKAVEQKPYHVISLNRGTVDCFEVDADGNIFITYGLSVKHVAKLDPGGNVLQEYEIDMEMLFPDTFSGFRDRCLDSEGHLYLLNRQTKELVVASDQGNAVTKINVDFDLPQYPAGDSRSTEINWLGVDNIGVYFFYSTGELFGEIVTYLVRVDLATHETIAKRFYGTRAKVFDDAVHDGSIYTISTKSMSGFHEGKFYLPGTRLYLDQFEFDTEELQRYYAGRFRDSGPYLYTYSSYDKSIYFYDLTFKFKSRPVEIMKFSLETSKLSSFTRIPGDDSVGPWNQFKASGDQLYYLSNMHEKVVIYQFQL